jgi:hypothetical protein
MIGTLLYYFSLAYNNAISLRNISINYISSIAQRIGQGYQVFKDNDSAWILPAKGLKCARRADIKPVHFLFIDGFVYDSKADSFYEIGYDLTKDVVSKKLSYIGGEVKIYGNGNDYIDEDITDWISQQHIYLGKHVPSPEQILIAWAIHSNRIGVLTQKVKVTLVDLMGDDVVYEWAC